MMVSISARGIKKKRKKRGFDLYVRPCSVNQVQFVRVGRVGIWSGVRDRLVRVAVNLQGSAQWMTSLQVLVFIPGDLTPPPLLLKRKISCSLSALLSCCCLTIYPFACP